MSMPEMFLNWFDEWKVTIPEYDSEGVKIQRFEITPQEAAFDQLRAAANPQRSNRAIYPGTYTRLVVDDVLWMTDTPAEITDLLPVDEEMPYAGSMLIVGLGLGVLLQRAIVDQQVKYIDVVERESRVVRAVHWHYEEMAAEHGTELHIHNADIHDWHAPKGVRWDLGFFDIWADINMDDRAEVTRLRNRFRDRLGLFFAWAQDERNAQAHRIRTKRGFY